ncbi:MAG: hypothetical protein IJ635_02685 [Bacteroidaceae bacterium]|nr:hypothetical protein [Bacteroidaceae bacterium]
MRKDRKNNPIRAYKRLLKDDRDWDYGYLLVLERKKLGRMYAYFSKSEITEDDVFVARDLAICLKLIDIILKEDAPYNTWLHRSFSSDEPFETFTENLNAGKRAPLARFPSYINCKNEKRFFRHSYIKDAVAKGDEYAEITYMVSLRHLKALHLYHLIREYRMLGWWD